MSTESNSSVKRRKFVQKFALEYNRLLQVSSSDFYSPWMQLSTLTQIAEVLLHLLANVNGLCKVRWRVFSKIMDRPFKTIIILSVADFLLEKSFQIMYNLTLP